MRGVSMRLIRCVACLAILVIGGTSRAQDFHPQIPRAWDDKDVQGFELPLARRARSPRYMTAEQYYALKVLTIYRADPAYAADKEPPGYFAELKTNEHEVLFDASKLRTKEDWIRAGKVVFEAETTFFPISPTEGGRKTPTSFAKYTKEGVLPGFVPGFTYIVRKKGVLEAGSNSCAGCHTRLMPDGTFLPGAQGNFPFGQNQRPSPSLTADQLTWRLNASWIVFGA